MKKILNTLDELNGSIRDFNWKLFSLDTETNNKLRLTEINLNDKTYKNGISISDGKISIYFHNETGQLKKFIQVIKNNINQDNTIIMHNAVFDMKVLHTEGVQFKKIELFDTMIAQHLINENSSKKLKDIAKDRLGVSVVYYEDAIENKETFCEYALNDAIYTYQIALLQKEELRVLKLERLFRTIEMPFQRVLLQMEIEGVVIDQPLLKEQKKVLEEEIIRLECELYNTLDEKYDMQTNLVNNQIIIVGKTNFNSTKQLSNIMFNRLGLDVIETTNNGQPKTGKITIEKYKDTIPFVSILYKYKIASKLYNAFINPMSKYIQSDGKIRASFNDTGTRTGRLSSYSPNLQQLPKARNDYKPVQVKKLFTVPQGYKMFSCDYSGQEIAVAAQVSKDPTLVGSLRKGYDMHLAIANQFYNLNIPEECLNKKHIDYNTWKNKFKTERQRAKSITFGLMYGKGAYGFSKDFNITEDEAQKIVDDYFKGMPLLKESIDKTHKELRDNGYVRNLAGRYRHFTPNEQGYYPGSAFRQAFNFKIQGFSADMIRAAAVNVYAKSLRKKKWDLKAVMTVHDECVYIVKEEYLNDAELFVKNVFENTVKFIVPTLADTSNGNNYEEAK